MLLTFLTLNASTSCAELGRSHFSHSGLGARLGRVSQIIENIKLVSPTIGRSSPPYAQNVRSSVLYWIASARWPGSIESTPDRSAIVRDTLRIRSWARAVSPCFDHGALQEMLGFGPQLAVFADLAGAHLGVGVDALRSLGKSVELDFTGAQDPGPDVGRTLGRSRCCAIRDNSPPGRRCECRSGRAAGLKSSKCSAR